MAVNRLCTAFRQITISRQSNIIVRYCSFQASKDGNNILPLPNLSNNVSKVTLPNVCIKFMPKTLNIDFGNPNDVNKKNINEMPLSKYIPSMEEPSIQRHIQQDEPLTNKSLELPMSQNILEKLLSTKPGIMVIRRKKMKKHKRKKLRKKMKFKWAKLRANRNSLKEKLFQQGLIGQIKEAQAFDAKTYVQSRLSILDKELLPKTYRGEILPPDQIKKFIQEKKEKREKWINRPRLTLD